eukprot:COSAG06_NODE_155_length_21876_cov_22.287643_19_plen_157_part_00
MLAAVARDRGSERGATARPEAGSRGHAPSATNATAGDGIGMRPRPPAAAPLSRRTCAPRPTCASPFPLLGTLTCSELAKLTLTDVGVSAVGAGCVSTDTTLYKAFFGPLLRRVVVEEGQRSEEREKTTVIRLEIAQPSQSTAAWAVALPEGYSQRS